MHFNKFLFLLISFTITDFEVLGQNPFNDTLEHKTRFNGNVSYQFGRLTDYEFNKDGALNYSMPVYRLRSTVTWNAGLRLFEKVYLRANFNYNLNRKINAPFLISDYSYLLERVSWDPHSFSYGYNNYEFNKYANSLDLVWESFLRGYYYARYFNHFPTAVNRLVRITKFSQLSYSLTMKYSLKYINEEGKPDGSFLEGKPVGAFNLRYILIKNIYLECAANYYPVKSTKRNWDPDYTYAFGYNSYAHGTFGVSYGNYSMNKFPWSREKMGNYGFLDGVFSFVFNYTW